MVDFQTLASKGYDEKLKCDTCTNYLSYFPISVCPTGKSICGRCTNTSPNSYHDEAFETIAQLLKFPCRYESKGCVEELCPKDVPNHEEQCSFRTVKCIVSRPSTCPWDGCLSDLLEHCKEKHSDMILQEEFAIDLFKSDECDHLFEHDGRLLIFTTKFDSTSKTLYITIHNNEYDLDMQVGEYQLCVKYSNKTVLVDLKSSSFKDRKFDEICLKLVESEDKIATAALTIGKNVVAHDTVDGIYSKLSSFLTCHICSKLARPPIYIHTDNSALVCSTCYDGMLDYPAYFKSPLEEIATLLDYKCKNDGCPFTSKYMQIQTHELCCMFAIKKCPLRDFGKCNWEGLVKDVDEHIMNNHRRLVGNSSSTTFEFAPKPVPKNYVIKFCDKLYLVTCTVAHGQYRFSVDGIGGHNDQFCYEIEIVDSTNVRRRLFREKCSARCSFEAHQLKPFIDRNRNVRFKVHILR